MDDDVDNYLAEMNLMTPQLAMALNKEGLTVTNISFERPRVRRSIHAK